MVTRRFRNYFAILSALMILHFPAKGETMNATQQALNQQQQDEARRQQLTPEGKTRLSSDAERVSDALILPEEKTCYAIHQVALEQKDSLPHWLAFSDLTHQVEGKCIGIQGIKALHKAVQNRLIAHGYITTRVLVPNQDLSKGVLTLKFLPGRISDIKFTSDANHVVHAWNNFPDSNGELLDLRGIEQGIENLQRIPGCRAQINLVPGDNPGETKVEVSRTQRKPWRFGAWADDSGSKYTGRYQGGMALYLDNPSSLNDMFYIAYGGGMKNEDGRRSDNASAFYSIPWGYWAFELYGSKYRYTQTVRSGNFSYFYRGDEKLVTAQLSRVMYRSASQKTTLSMKALKRDSHYFLNDVEVEVQHRDTSSWKLNLEHLAYFSFGQLKASLGYQHAAPWFNEQPDAEEIVGNADRLARIITMSMDGTFPFSAAGLSMSYEPHFMRQTTPDRLTQPDKINLGNRWTVRGFDGETTLYADKGWYLRNDFNLNLPSWGMQPYVGLDYGEVSGSRNDYWSGKHIAGAATGVRGVKGQFGYDFFVGIPVLKPDEMHTSPVSLGFTVQWQY